MDREGDHDPARQAVDERVRRSKEAVLVATFELLSEAGFGGVSVDAVSERSGVAKTTIYRHWPSRTALLLDACSRMSPRREPPDTGRFESDLTVLLTDLAHRLQTARWPLMLPSVIDAAERDPDIARVYSSLHAELVSPFRKVVERAQERGEFPTSVEASETVARLLGPLFYRRWFSRQAIDEGFVARVVEGVLSQMRKSEP